VQQLVDETCFNKARGLCVNCAPNLAAEMEAERSSVELSQMREAMSTQKVFSGDVSGPRHRMPELRQARRQREVLRQLRHGSWRLEVLQVRRRTRGRHSLLRELREQGRLAAVHAGRGEAERPSRRGDWLFWALCRVCAESAPMNAKQLAAGWLRGWPAH